MAAVATQQRSRWRLSTKAYCGMAARCLAACLATDDDNSESPAPAAAAPTLPAGGGGDSFFTAEALVASVASGAIALLRGRWLIELHEHGGRLERRQDLPTEAFLSADELRRLMAALGDTWGLLLVAISYRWLTAEHPDPDGFHLAIITRVARLYLKGMMHDAHCSPLVQAFDLAGLSSSEADFGVLWDFGSLHQHPKGGKRTEEESRLFKQGLSALPLWYGHEATTMWMQPDLPEGFGERMAALGLAETYEMSGWCFVESSVSAGVKPSEKRLNLSLRTENALKCAYGMPIHWAPEDRLTGVCAAQRVPPLLPQVMEGALIHKRFTSGADRAVVAELYRSYFVGVTSCATRLDFARLQWKDAEAAALAALLPTYARLTALDVSNNEIGGDGARQLAAAVLAHPKIEVFSHVPIKRMRADSFDELELWAKDIGTAGGLVVAAVLREMSMSRLTMLNVRGNQLGDEGAAAICDALRESKVSQVKELDVRHNRISGQGARQLAAAVLANHRIETFNTIPVKEMRADALTELDLRSQGLDNKGGLGIEGGLLVASLLPGMGQLISLNVQDTELGESAAAICDALRQSKVSNVRELDLEYNQIGPDGAKAIAALVSSSKSLAHLNVFDNDLGDDGECAISAANAKRAKPLAMLRMGDY